MLNNVCFSRSKTKDDTTSIKSKGRFHFKYVVIFFIKSTLHFISWWVWRRMSEQSQNNRSSGWRWRWRVPLVFLVSSFHNSVKKGMREQLPGMIARFIVLFWLGSPSYPLVSQMREWKKRSCLIFWVSQGFDTQASMKWTWCWFKVFCHEYLTYFGRCKWGERNMEKLFQVLGDESCGRVDWVGWHLCCC